MNSKIALVTGASSGFGKLISLELANAGYYVFACARRFDSLEKMQSQSKQIEAVQLDVTNSDNVQACMSHILQTKGKVDLLVNNAGHGLYSTVEDADITDIIYQFEVNVFGAVRMTQAVLPIMREQQAGKIINISSVAGQISMPLFGYYSGSKHALEAISDALRLEVKPFGIDVVIVEPGVYKTNFRGTALDHSMKNRKTRAYDKMIKIAFKFLSDKYEHAPDPIAVARLVNKIAQTSQPKRRYVTGRGSNLFIWFRHYFGYAFLDKAFIKLFGIGK